MQYNRACLRPAGAHLMRALHPKVVAVLLYSVKPAVTRRGKARSNDIQRVVFHMQKLTIQSQACSMIANRA